MAACEPTRRQVPCRSTDYPRFQPGIATQVINHCAPLAGPGCGETAVCGQPAWTLDQRGNLRQRGWIKGWAINQLLTDARVTCEENPLGVASGGWWADSFRRDSFVSGSKLWSLRWETNINHVLVLAKRYAQEALNYLIVWGIASKITVNATLPQKRLVKLDITIEGPGAQAVSVTVAGQALPDYSWLWREYA